MIQLIHLLRETARETKSPNHFAGSRNFIMLADSGQINSQSPEPWSVSGNELYTPKGLCNQGSFAVDGSQVVRKTSQLQKNKLVTEFFLTPPTECGHNHRKPCKASLKVCDTFEPAESCLWPQSREFQANSRHTVNPRKIARLAPAHLLEYIQRKWCQHTKETSAYPCLLWCHSQ
jgi:hypothetical protein